MRTKRSKSFALELVIQEDYYDISVPAGVYPSKSKAEAAGEKITAALVEHRSTPAIALYYRGHTSYVYDTDCSVTEVSAAKRRIMGPPLDITDPVDGKKAWEALMSGDPAYHIDPDDMVPSSKTLADFLRETHSGYSLSIMAYGVQRSDSTTS